METVEQRYEKLMGRMTLEEFTQHLQDHSLPYTSTPRHPINGEAYVVITPHDRKHKERYFLRDHTQFTPKN